MAGGKETPRQKLIGMMYLVLTALLALNVSTTVLDKFIFLNQSLERAVRESSTRNSVTISSIQKQVEDLGNRPDDKLVVSMAQELHKKTTSTIKELEQLKKTFVEITGGFADGHENDYAHMKGKTNYDVVGHYMMSKELGGQGHGKDLEKLLNSYSAYLRDLMQKAGAEEEEIASFGKIALDAEDDPIYQHDENQKGKKFAELAFESTPTPAGLATVSEFQAQVAGYEARALDILANKVGAKDLKFDKIVAMVKPESKVVAAGTKYKAEMFIAASSTSANPTMKYNGREIPVADGMGQVEFTAVATKFDKENRSVQSYKAEITVNTPGGGDTTFVNDIEYVVTKPVIQIQSASVQALFLNCGNELDVQVPALGTSYNPSFTAKGASVYPGKAGVVTVVPKAAKVELNVSSNGNFIGGQLFQVRRIPKPEVKVYDRGREIDQKKGVASCPRSIQLRAVPDESFQQFLPKDARFRVVGAEVALVRAGRAVKVFRASDQDVSLNQIRNLARSGDIVVIEVKKVVRKNFRDDIEDFNNFGPRILQVRIN